MLPTGNLQSDLQGANYATASLTTWLESIYRVFLSYLCFFKFSFCVSKCRYNRSANSKHSDNDEYDKQNT